MVMGVAIIAHHTTVLTGPIDQIDPTAQDQNTLSRGRQEILAVLYSGHPDPQDLFHAPDHDLCQEPDQAQEADGKKSYR